MSAWYCVLCGAPARPGSVQPAASPDPRYATGVCSGEHQYGTPDRANRLPGADGRDIPAMRQRRVGMVLRDTPPDPPATPRRARQAPSLPLFGVTRDA